MARDDRQIEVDIGFCQPLFNQSYAEISIGGMTHTHTHIHTHARTHVRTHTHTHARTHACTHAPTHTYTHIHTRARRHTYKHKHTHKDTRTSRRSIKARMQRVAFRVKILQIFLNMIWWNQIYYKHTEMINIKPTAIINIELKQPAAHSLASHPSILLMHWDLFKRKRFNYFNNLLIIENLKTEIWKYSVIAPGI